jgi:hypothetical protein
MKRPAQYSVVQPPDPAMTPFVEVGAECPPDPAMTPSPDIPATAWRGVAEGAVGFVQAVASAKSAAPIAHAAARRERTSMNTSEAMGRLSLYRCTNSRLLHPSRQSRFGSQDRSFGRRDPCW